MVLYHGTNTYSANYLLQTKDVHFNIITPIQGALYSKNKLDKAPGSLGFGFYTFEDNPNLALKFAQKFKHDDAKVLVITPSDKYSSEYILDLTEEENANAFRIFGNRSKNSELADKIFHAFKIHHTNADVYAGVVTELFITYLSIHHHKRVRFVKKNTETRLNKSYQTLGVPNGTEVTIRFPKDIKNISEYKCKGGLSK